MLLFKSPDGNSVTVVVGTCEQTLTMAEWSDIIARPQARRPRNVEKVEDRADRNHSNHSPNPRPVQR